MRPGPDNRWFFVHVMKTGGNTVRGLFDRNVDRRHLYPNPSDQPRTRAKVHLPFLQTLSPERLAEIHVFTAHLPACAQEMLPYPTSSMTVLREPIGRTISWLRQRQRLHAPDSSLEEVYEDVAFRQAYADEHQTRMFSIRMSDDVEAFTNVIGVDDQRLAEAKDRLDKTDIVGFQEEMPRFIDAVCDRLRFEKRRTPAKNVADGDVSIPDGLRRRIVADNPYDLAFYDYARETRAQSL